MKMRWLLSIGVIVSMLIVTACGGSGNNANTNTGENNPPATGAAQPIKMRLGHVGAEDSNADLPAKYFAEMVKEKTNGEIEIDVYPSGQLGGDRDMLENVQNGVLELAWIALGNYGAITPVFDGFVMPFLIEDADQAYEVYKTEVADKALQSLERFGITGLGIIPAGFQQFGTNGKPIQTPEDLAGQNIRAPQSPFHIEALKALGANVTSIAFAEIYSSLQTGVIDGTEVPTPAWVANKMYEVVDSVSITNSYPWSYVITMSSEVFNKLTDEQKQAFREAAAETLDWSHPTLKQMEIDAIAELKEKGVNVVENIDQSKFRALMEPVYEKTANTDPLIKETIETIRSLQ